MRKQNGGRARVRQGVLGRKRAPDDAFPQHREGGCPCTYLGDLGVTLALEVLALLGDSLLRVLLDSGEAFSLRLESRVDGLVRFALLLEQSLHLLVHTFSNLICRL